MIGKEERKMRVAVGGIFHETNTYVTEFSGYTTLDTLTAYRGQEMLKLKNTAMGGALDECLAQDWELLLTSAYIVNKSFGLVTDEAYNAVKEDIITRLKQQLPVDIFYLIIHGAGTVANTSDLEGDLAASIREVIGPAAKIVASADLHGKVTDVMASQYDFFSACKEYPHTDLSACARDAMRQGADIFLGNVTPHFYYERIPLLLPPTANQEADTFTGIIREKCLAYEKDARVLNCSVMHGFPYQDTEYCGMYVMTTTNGNPELAKTISKELALWIWNNRVDSQANLPNVEETITQAKSILTARRNSEKMTTLAHKPIVIADYADNPGGGATGDTTHLLAALLEASLGKVVMMSIRDPETVDKAVASGVGTFIDVKLGGKTYPRGGAPINAKAYVKSISDGVETVRGPMFNGITFDLGASVRLQINNVDIIVQKGLCQAFDDVQGRAHGIIVEEYDVVCVKSMGHWRAFYSLISDDLLMADSPGVTSVQIKEFKHTQLTHPCFPLDEHSVYPIVN